MNSFLLWATLGLAAFVPAIDGSRPCCCRKCDCCGCCETGTCTCTTCTCACCGDARSTAGPQTGRDDRCGTGCRD